MVAIEPLIGAHIPDQSDGPLGGLQVGNALRDAIPYTVPRFASVSVRDTKYAAWVTAGGTLVDGMLCFTTAEQVLWVRMSGAWTDYRAPASGKAWRTAGNGPALVANTPTKVGLDASRVTGGVTFNNTDDTLTLPLSGYYDLRAKGYATGGTGYTHSWRIVRVRSATADKEIVTSPAGRKPDAGDEPLYLFDTLPLQAGDSIYLRTYFSTTAGTYYGIDEVSGVFLSARYVGPLAGATPV